MKFTTAFTLAAPLILLSACGEETASDTDTTETGGEVVGDVLGGTISDDMLPLEELTSVSPPAERTGTDGGDSGAADPASSDSDGAETEPAEAETPEAEAPSDAPASE